MEGHKSDEGGEELGGEEKGQREREGGEVVVPSPHPHFIALSENMLRAYLE